MNPSSDLEPGAGYVVREPKPAFTDSLFKGQLEAGVPGLVLTRMHPDRVRQDRGLGDARIVWLAHTPGEGVHDPSDLEGLAKLARTFLDDHRGKGVILLDGLEYLLANKNALETAAFVAQLHASVADAKAVLLIPADPQGIPEKEWPFLMQGLRVIDPEKPGP